MKMNHRDKPFELLQLEALRGRIVFSSEQERLYRYLTTGFIGECLSDQMVEKSAGRTIQMHDLLLTSGGRTCQVDSLLVVDGKIYLLEVKNWEGSFEVQDGRFSGLSACPLVQLQRSKMIVEHLLVRYGFRVEVEARVLFVNPKLQLYGLMRSDPVLLLHQIEPYLHTAAGAHTWNSWGKKIADFLLQQHVPENRFANPVVFDRLAVARGVMCVDCRVRMQSYDLLRLQCIKCGQTELKRECLARSKAEMDVLFDEPVHPKYALYNWCDGLVSRRMIYDFSRQRLPHFD